MTASKGSDKRFVLPRWRTWQRSVNTGELASLESEAVSQFDGHADEIHDDELARRLEEFKNWSGVYEAADVVSTAVVLGLEDAPGVEDAARLVYKSDLPIGRQLASQILHGNSSYLSDSNNFQPDMELDHTRFEDQERNRVARSRKIVKRHPRNALRWADLALAHTVLGNSDSASKAIRISLALSNGNRFILRAASRFYVHEEDLDAARSVLVADTARLIRDPWLAAAEISIAELAEQPLRFAKAARRLLESDLPARHVSELAAALATAELKSGNARQARRLLARALRDPTENSLAQAEWSVDWGVDVLQEANAEPLLSFEANARHALRDGAFGVAMEQAMLWLGDQPFALDPAVHLSYIASTLSENYKVAMMACQRGLKTNPGDKVLLNNLAFAQANAGLPNSAQETISKLIMTDGDDGRVKLMSTATRGLIAFRNSAFTEGRLLYGESIQGWRRLGNERDNAARAAIFWAREEVRAKTSYIDDSIKIVDVLMDRASADPDLKLLYDRLISVKNESTR